MIRSLLLIATLSLPAVAQVGLGLAPLRMELKARPGETYSDSLTITNESEQATRIRASLLDFWIDENQEPQFRPVVEAQAGMSCRSWIKINPSEFELAPKQQKAIRFTVTYPVSLKEGSYNCALGFTGLAPIGMGTNGVVTNLRLVSALYVTMGQPTPAGEVKKIEITSKGDAPDQKRQAALFLENKGSVYFRPIGTLDILDEKNRKVESVPFRALPVLPGKIQRFLFALKSEYVEGQRVRARFEIGDGEIQEVFATAQTTGEAKN